MYRYDKGTKDEWDIVDEGDDWGVPPPDFDVLECDPKKGDYVLNRSKVNYIDLIIQPKENDGYIRYVEFP